MKYNCIVIDDEVLALDLLEDYIAKFPFLELVGKFESPIRAMDVMVNKPIDLIFLDINMPGLNGMKFYENLPVKPKVIFTTAHHEYAVNAFDSNAVDYLLKPIGFERFFKAVSKAFNINSATNIPGNAGRAAYPSELSTGDYIFVKVEQTTHKINLCDILYFEGYKDYVKIHLSTQDHPILTLNSIKHYELTLLSKGFIRIHKRYIISVDKIEQIRRNRVKMANREEFLSIGDSFRSFFMESVIIQNL